MALLKTKVHRTALWGMLLVIVTCGFFSTVSTAPFSDVHWDSPIHLYQGKRYAQTHLLADYAASASTIGSKVKGTTVVDSGFWSPYWHFLHLGQTIIVGTVIGEDGANVATIALLQRIYSGLIAVFIVLAALIASSLAKLLRIPLEQEKILLGSVASALLLVLSDIHGYMGRSLVGETPAMVMLALAIGLFLLGQQRRSPMWPIASGVAAFLLYVIRADVIWPYLTFLMVFGLAQWKLSAGEQWLRGYVLALLASFALWLVYLAWMYPLPNPQLIVAFARLSDVDPGEASPLRLTEAVGLLLIGVGLSARKPRQLWIVPVAWAVLALLPTFPSMLEQRSVQTRMFVPYVLLPAFLASTFGWGKMLSFRPGPSRLSAIVAVITTLVIVAAIAQPFYKRIKSLPGLWRVQSINNALRPLFVIPPYEKQTYDLSEWLATAVAIRSAGYKAPIVVDKDIPPGALYLLDYFMDDFPKGANVVNYGEPVHRGNCPTRPPASEQYSLCFQMTEVDVAELIAKSGGVFWIEAGNAMRIVGGAPREMAHFLVYQGTHIRIWYRRAIKLADSAVEPPIQGSLPDVSRPITIRGKDST